MDRLAEVAVALALYGYRVVADHPNINDLLIQHCSTGKSYIVDIDALKWFVKLDDSELP